MSRPRRAGLSAASRLLDRLVRPSRHPVMRLIECEPLAVSDILAVARDPDACEREPGCCDAYRIS